MKEPAWAESSRTRSINARSKLRQQPRIDNGTGASHGEAVGSEWRDHNPLLLGGRSWHGPGSARRLLRIKGRRP